jgi:hypothetical protein
MGIFGLAQAPRSAWRKRVALIFVVASMVTACIVYLFEVLFLVRLP